MTARYALYFAPAAKSKLWQAASQWLGRDARTNQTHVQPEIGSISAAELASFTQAPRLYGFHATLKPPMRLAQDCSLPQLRAAIAEQCSQINAFELPALRLKVMGNFLAMRLQQDSQAMTELATRLVLELDEFRAPPTELEKQKRLAKPLTERQLSYLQQYGYPYVCEEFRFHFTLSSSLPEPYLLLLQQAASQHFAEALQEPIMVDQVALYVQESAEQQSPFVLVEEFGLAQESAATVKQSRVAEPC